MIDTAAHPPIFIIGSGRSGSSLLRAMLNAHPRIYLVQEAAFYTVTEIPPFWLSGSKRLELYLRSFSFRWLGVDPEEIRAAFPPPLPRERLSEVLSKLLQDAAARRGKPRWGEKDPLNTLQLERIFDGFPDAQVVRMVRDPRGILDSYARMPFSSSSALFMGLSFRNGARQLAPFLDRLLTVRLEDLVARPRATMERVLEFVGEPWDDAVLEHHRHLGPDDGPPFPWVVDAYRPISTRPPSWPQRLTPAKVRLIERFTRPYMTANGYEPLEMDAEPGAWSLARELAADTATAVHYAWRGSKLLARIGLRPTADPAENQRLFVTLNPRREARLQPGAMPDPP